MKLWQLQITVPVSSLTSKSYDISQGSWPSAASLNQRQASDPTAAPATLLKADLPWNSGLQAHLAGNSIPETPTNEKNTNMINMMLYSLFYELYMVSSDLILYVLYFTI